MGRIISKLILSKLISKNWFPKLEQFDWLIVKSVLILANQNAREISFDEINLGMILPLVLDIRNLDLNGYWVPICFTYFWLLSLMKDTLQKNLFPLFRIAYSWIIVIINIHTQTLKNLTSWNLPETSNLSLHNFCFNLTAAAGLQKSSFF